MNFKSVTAIALCVVFVALVAFSWSPASVEATPQVQQNRNQMRQSSIQYAQLTISEGNYVFEVSGTNVRPRTFDLRGLYLNLGGRFRPTFTNLLGEIGADGWELVEVSQERDVYTFMR